MKKKKIRRDRESGQSLLELIAMIIPFFTVVFMFVQVCLSLGVANFFQYATFMASRVLLVSRPTIRDQIQAASGALEEMVQPEGRERFPGISRAEGDGEPRGAFIGPSPRVRLGQEEARTSTWEQGVRYRFSVKLSLFPLRRRTSSNNRVILESESLLGREPSESECTQQLRAKGGLFDNGC